MAASGEKPYRTYKGGRSKGHVPLERTSKQERQSFRTDGGGPRRQVERRRRRRWTWPRVLVVALVTLVVLFAVWSVAGYMSVRSGVSDANKRLPSGTASALTKQGGLVMSSPTNILLLGTDHADNGQAGRSSDEHSDSMMLLRTDPARHRLIYLSIPRDLRVSVPGYGDQKINAAMQLGGPSLAIKTVAALTGMPVNHVVIVDFGSFEKLIDAVGGIDVNIPENILSNRFDCPYSTAARCQAWPGWRFHKGVQHLSGHQALIYSRIRENQLNPADTDISRAEHQQQVMQATLSKLASAGTFFRLPYSGSKLLAPIATDLSTWDFLQLGWVKFRANPSSTLHCRLGGTSTSIGGGSYIIGGQENISVIQEVLGNSAPQPPSPGGGLYAPGCFVGSSTTR
ncbi:MAG TPA: LCP family protein [Gaiellaceae bacterium]|nr:LCP family protein [Gaiellaceae bacterium]